MANRGVWWILPVQEMRHQQGKGLSILFCGKDGRKELGLEIIWEIVVFVFVKHWKYGK